MKIFLVFLFLVLMLIVPENNVVASCAPTRSAVGAANLVGRWRVKLTLIGGVEKNLIFEAGARGSGFFRLLDTGPNNKPVTTPQPAVWSELTNDRVSFSGEVELPLGTCCREIGTLTFKGRFSSRNLIAGRLVFVTSIDEEENPIKLRSLVGTFTATRLSAR